MGVHTNIDNKLIMIGFDTHPCHGKGIFIPEAPGGQPQEVVDPKVVGEGDQKTCA